jgi:hypothetical protein
MIDMIAHLARQVVFSKATFGPGPRTKGVIDHVRKELKEVEKVYEADPNSFVPTPSEPPLTRQDGIRAQHAAAAKEWTDVAILGLDGLWRSIASAHPHWTADQIAEEAMRHIKGKQGKNEMREWPDWRTMSADGAIEHVRGKHD